MPPDAMQERGMLLLQCPDSSSDEEGPSGTSIYWHLPRPHRSHYKSILRAFRRAHNRLSYISFLRARGFSAIDLMPAGSPNLPQQTPAEHPGNRAGGVDAEARDLEHGRHIVALPLVDAGSLAVEALQLLVPDADAQGDLNAAHCMHHGNLLFYNA